MRENPPLNLNEWEKNNHANVTSTQIFNSASEEGEGLQGCTAAGHQEAVSLMSTISIYWSTLSLIGELALRITWLRVSRQVQEVI